MIFGCAQSFNNASILVEIPIFFLSRRGIDALPTSVLNKTIKQSVKTKISLDIIERLTKLKILVRFDTLATKTISANNEEEEF